MCLQITCFSNLHGTDVSDTGLEFSGDDDVHIQ